MNCNADDFGPVDVDALMKSHYKKINDDVNRDDEPLVSTTDPVDSQECVGCSMKDTHDTKCEVHEQHGKHVERATRYDRVTYEYHTRPRMMAE